MRESVGFTFLFNFFATFLVILIFVLVSIMNYMKAYKVNSQIVSAIEKRGGINASTKKDIQNILSSSGYHLSTTRRSCNGKYGKILDAGITNYEVCLYLANDGDVTEGETYNGTLRFKAGDAGRTFQIGVLTYIYFDMPIIHQLLRIPVYTTTDNIYIFPRTVRG